MNILSIVWYKVLPPKFGGQKGIAFFNHYLSLHHPLVCICSANNEAVVPYKLLPALPLSKWQFILPSCRRLIKRTAIAEKTTHIILEHPYHGIAAVKAAKATGAILIVHSHNIESERFREIGKWWWKLLFRYERWVHRKARFNLFKTETEKQWAVQHFGLNPDHCMCVPYGTMRPVINENARQLIREKYHLQAGEKLLLFAGTLDYEPNAAAVENIYSKIAPALLSKQFACKIIICGRNRFPAFQYLKQLSHPFVIDTGEQDDIGDYFSAADVFINPVEKGGGIQTKNIDAISYNCNTVTFQHTMDGIHQLVCGNKLFVAADNDWENFIQQIIAASQTRENTLSAFYEYYDPARIVTEVVSRLENI